MKWRFKMLALREQLGSSSTIDGDNEESDLEMTDATLSSKPATGYVPPTEKERAEKDRRVANGTLKRVVWYFEEGGMVL